MADAEGRSNDAGRPENRYIQPFRRPAVWGEA